MGSFEWLYERVRNTCTLRNPRLHWEDWAAWMRRSPGRFKGFFQRARCLQGYVTHCIAAHAELHQTLARLCGISPDSHCSLQAHECSDACLICRRAFGSLAAWAAHAARKHGYRAPTTRLAQGRVCRGCGRVYTRPSRLKRHLDHSDSCRQHWGVFTPLEEDAAFSSHLQAPPADVEGAFWGTEHETMAEDVCRDLMSELGLLCSGSVVEVLEIVSRFCGPVG